MNRPCSSRLAWRIPSFTSTLLSAVTLSAVVLAAAGVVSAAATCDGDDIGNEPCFTGRENVAPGRLRFAGCERVQHEHDGYCLTTIGEQPTLVGLGSGNLCTIDTPLQFAAMSLSWRGEAVYFCSDDFGGSVMRGSLPDGNFVQFSTLPCSAVTDYAGGILVRGALLDLVHGSLVYSWFRDRDSLLAGVPDATFDAVVWDDGAFTTRGPLLLSAWHSTTTINVADLRRGVRRDTVTLDRPDDWILGLASLGDGRVVVLGGITGDEIVVFRSNGRRIKEIPLSDRGGDGPPAFGAGLACFSEASSRTPLRPLAILPR